MPWSLGSEVHVDHLHARENVHIDGDPIALSSLTENLTGAAHGIGLGAMHYDAATNAVTYSSTLPQFYSAYFAGSTSDNAPVSRDDAGTTSDSVNYSFNQWTAEDDSARNPNNTSTIYQVTYTGVFVITWQLGFQLQTGFGRGPVRTYLFRSEPPYTSISTLAETRDVLPGSSSGHPEYLTTSGTTLCKLNVGDRMSVGFRLDDSSLNLQRAGCRWIIHQIA